MDFMSLFSDRMNCMEMNRLADMLRNADIPFRRTPVQILYYGPEGVPEHKMGEGFASGSVCDVIPDGDLLEISGLLSREEIKEVNDTVLRNLTAEDVFERIKNHYDGIRKN